MYRYNPWHSGRIGNFTSRELDEMVNLRGDGTVNSEDVTDAYMSLRDRLEKGEGSTRELLLAAFALGYINGVGERPIPGSNQSLSMAAGELNDLNDFAGEARLTAYDKGVQGKPLFGTARRRRSNPYAPRRSNPYYW